MNNIKYYHLDIVDLVDDLMFSNNLIKIYMCVCNNNQ